MIATGMRGMKTEMNLRDLFETAIKEFFLMAVSYSIAAIYGLWLLSHVRFYTHGEAKCLILLLTLGIRSMFRIVHKRIQNSKRDEGDERNE